MLRQFDMLTFQVDHIIAQKHHGKDESGNLALACFACNKHKGPNIAGIDAQTGEVTPLFLPGATDGKTTSNGMVAFCAGGPRQAAQPSMCSPSISPIEFNFERC
jgi:hypothetical protein